MGKNIFADFLDRHPLEPLLCARPDWGIPPAYDRAGWKGITPTHREEIRSLVRSYSAVPYPMRTAGGFMAFVQNGSRQADEQPYFTRRRKLCVSALGCSVDEGASLADVVDGIWCICEETSWVISAHNVNPIPGAPAAASFPLPDPRKPYVDLFAAQTAMILSLVKYLLKDRLDGITPLICQRIDAEIESRVHRPFVTRDDFWWMGFRRRDLNNWTPWILSNIMLSACLSPMEPLPLAALLDRACRMLDRWLDCVPADGGCDEGAGYWNMAGGALLDCLQTLETVTGGRASFWDHEKIRNIMCFPLSAEIGGGWFLNFADCDARPFLSGERLCYAGQKLGDSRLTDMGARYFGTLAGQISDVPHFIRLLRMLFTPVFPSGGGVLKEDVWLPDLQVRVVRRGGMTLCCKGGHNGENHNHNDVGSFMLYLNDAPEIVDAGNMVYTAKTFSSERYSLWNVRSAYHNLPLIGDCEQLPGAERAAEQVRALENGLVLHMEKAYGKEAGLVSLRRELTLNEDALTVRDSVRLSRKSTVTWVFMLRHRPCLSSGTVTAGAIAFSVPGGLICETEEIPVQDARMARSFPGSLWRLKLTAPGSLSQDMIFTVRRHIPHA